MSDTTYDVVIVGAGIAGTLIARELGQQGKRVLILEAGIDASRGRERYLETFYKNTVKTPESPYPPVVEKPSAQATPRATIADTFASNIEPDFPGNLSEPDGYIYDPEKSYLLQKGPLPFASTYERVAGGTTWHWLGTSLRFLEHDFTMRSTYCVEKDWPMGIDALLPYYNRAEAEIGVAASAQVQEEELGSVGLRYAPPDYQYPMQQIPLSQVDTALGDKVNGIDDFVDFEGLGVQVTPTPAGRNSQSIGASSRRTCAGNTNCIPICPIQAKYDATVTLSQALQTGHVTLISQAVAKRVCVDENGRISGIEYLTWDGPQDAPTITGTATAVGKVYVIAAHAIETPRLLLMSRTHDQGALANGVANSSDQVGRNLMDHPLYLSWGLMPEPVWGFRGPLTTSGIETLRDGAFRSQRAAWRVEVGNEGWNFSIGDPWTTTNDFIGGPHGASNNSQLNPENVQLFGDALVARLNHAFTRQWRMGFLVEQTPEPGNRVCLSSTRGGATLRTDGLGLPRPVIHYDLSDYTKLGFVFAEIFARQVYQKLGGRNYTLNTPSFTTDSVTVQNPKWFALEDAWRHYFTELPAALKDPRLTCQPADAEGVPEGFQYFGSGHIVGTYAMGASAADSVVDRDQRSWDHANLFLVGSGVFPTITTANPTLTIAALALQAAETIMQDLG